MNPVAATTSSTAKPAKFSLDILEATLATMKATIDAAPPEPIAVWMRDAGFAPEHGWVLVLPSDFAAGVGMFPPAYVLISTMIVTPMLMNSGNAANPKDFPWNPIPLLSSP